MSHSKHLFTHPWNMIYLLVTLLELKKTISYLLLVVNPLNQNLKVHFYLNKPSYTSPSWWGYLGVNLMEGIDVTVMCVCFASL